jgi:hypothetical protein
MGLKCTTESDHPQISTENAFFKVSDVAGAVVKSRVSLGLIRCIVIVITGSWEGLVNHHMAGTGRVLSHGESEP